MTQYVQSLPLPSIETKIGKEIVSKAKKLCRERIDESVERELGGLVGKSFGF